MDLDANQQGAPDAQAAAQRELDWLIALASAFQAQQRQLQRQSPPADGNERSQTDAEPKS